MQVTQEAGKVVCYSHLIKNILQFVVIHKAKGFIIINEEEVDILWGDSLSFYDLMYTGNLISGFSAFSKFNIYIYI